MGFRLGEEVVTQTPLLADVRLSAYSRMESVCRGRCLEWPTEYRGRLQYGVGWRYVWIG